MGRKRRPLTAKEHEFYAGFKQIYPPPLTPENVVGCRIRIHGDHPWAGHEGTVVSMDHTLAGWGLRVNLDCGESCFVFRPTEGTITRRAIQQKIGEGVEP
jgi:hypothetical protein